MFVIKALSGNYVLFLGGVPTWTPRLEVAFRTADKAFLKMFPDCQHWINVRGASVVSDPM